MTGRALVSGAQGFVGRYVVASLLDHGFHVVGTGRSPRNDGYFTHGFDFAGASLPTPLPADLAERLQRSSNYQYVACDLADAAAAEALAQLARPDRIIHLAGALRDEAAASLATCNIDTTVNLATAAAALPAPPLFIYGSSGSVVGEQSLLPVPENTVPNPIGAYALSKHAAEIEAAAIASRAGMPLVIARIFNMLGPGLQPRHFASYLAHRIAEMETLGESGTIEVGPLTTTRDFIDVRDVAEFMSRYMPSCASTTVNLAAGREIPMQYVASIFLEMARRPISFKAAPDRARDGANRIYADTTSMEALGLPTISLDQSIADMLNFARLLASRSYRAPDRE